MNNSVVLVMNDPVEWKTLVRRNGGDPDRLNNNDAVPYYMDREYVNEQFSEEERRAIVSTNPSPELILVKQEHKNGEVVYVPIKDGADGIVSFFDNERVRVHNLVYDFLSSLGGDYVCVNTVHNRVEQNIAEQSSESSVEAKNPVAGGSAVVTANSMEKSNAKESLAMGTFTKHTDPNFRKAHELLDRYPWMKSSFGNLLEAVEGKRIHDEYRRTFRQEVSKEISEGFQLGIDVAAKYQLINVNEKADLKNKLRKAVHDVEEWEYSIKLP